MDSVTFFLELKRNRSRNMKLEYIVVYENISDKFDNGHCRIKVKVMVGLFSLFGNGPKTQLGTSRKLILNMYVHLIIHNI